RQTVSLPVCHRLNIKKGIKPTFNPFVSLSTGSLFLVLFRFGCLPGFLFCFGSLSFRCFRFCCCSFSCSLNTFFCFLGTSAASACFCLLGSALLRVQGIEVNQLDQAHFSVITDTGITELDDAGISSRTIGNLSSYFTEKGFHRLLVLEVRKHRSPGMSCIVLSFGKQRFNVLAKCFCLCYRGRNAFIQYQRSSKVREQRCPVPGLSSQMIDLLTVSHDY